jgi:putative ABC transport system permease protein
MSLFQPRFKRQIHGAWRSLFLHRLRSLLSTLGVAIAVAAFMAMLAVGEGAKREILAQVRAFGANTVLVRSGAGNSDASQGLTLAEVGTLRRAMPGVQRIGSLRESGLPVAGVAGPEPIPVLAVSGDFLAMRGVVAAQGRLAAPIDGLQRRRVAVVGNAVAERLGINGRPGQTLLIGGETYGIIGVLAPRERATSSPGLGVQADLDQSVLIPAESLPDGLHGGAGDVWIEMAPELGPLPGAEVLRSAIQRLRPRGEATDLQIIVPIEILRRETAIRGVLNNVLAALAVIALVVGGIGVMNITLANVTERRAEIGLRRAVGATRREIIHQFLAEATLLTLVGGAAGVLLGTTAAMALGLATGWSIAITPWSVLLALLAAALAGIGAGIYPARQAANIAPAEALR